MTPDGTRLVRAAAQLIGTPFRLHGRDPATGLDCIGLAYASLVAIGRNPDAPEGYRLRNTDLHRWTKKAEISGFLKVEGQKEPGDLVMLETSPGQQHLVVIETRRTCIHAHAGLKKVVREDFNLDQRILAHWRLNTPSERNA